MLGPNELAGYEALLRIFVGSACRPSRSPAPPTRSPGSSAAPRRRCPTPAPPSRRRAISDDEWWNARSPLLDEMVGDRWDTQLPRCPDASSAEQAFDQVDRPDDSLPYTVRQAFDTFEFGLQRLLDGFAAHIAASTEQPPPSAAAAP